MIRRVFRVAFLGVLCVLCGESAFAQPKDVEVKSSVDRSAVWIADRFTYTIELTCRRGVDILPDDLNREKLRLDGPEVVGVDSTKVDAGNGVTVYRFSYHMTTFRLEPPTQKIGELSVRYYIKRPGQRVEDTAPAGDVTVPGAIVAVRSVLPDAQDTASFQDRRPPAPREARFSSLQPLGLGLVLVSIVPAVAWGGVIVGRLRTRRAHRSSRQVRHDERTMLEGLRSIDVGTEAGRRDAYDRVSALVRQHLREACGVPADGLTPREVGSALASKKKDAPIDLVTSLLADCERARYGGADGLASPDACRAAIERAEQVVATVH